MTIDIISDNLALLERVQISGKEVPAFNRVVGALLLEREALIKEKENQK